MTFNQINTEIRQDLVEELDSISLTSVFIDDNTIVLSESPFAKYKIKPKAESLVAPIDIDKFASVIQDIVGFDEQSSNIPEKNQIIVTTGMNYFKYFSDNKSDNGRAGPEVISLNLRRREPGSYSGKKPFDESRPRILAPRLMSFEYIIDHPEIPNAVLEVKCCLFDNMIKFTCWAMSPEVADRRAIWLEQIMEKYHNYIIARGIRKCFFYGREADEHTVESGNVYFLRHLFFYVQTERLVCADVSKLSNIDFHLNIVQG